MNIYLVFQDLRILLSPERDVPRAFLWNVPFFDGCHRSRKCPIPRGVIEMPLSSM